MGTTMLHTKLTSIGTVAAAVLVLILVWLVGPAGSAPPSGAKVSVVTLTGGPVTIDTPGEIVPIPLSPVSEASFTQRAGEVVTLSLDFTYTGNPNDSVFCDLFTSAGMTNQGSANAEESTVANMQTHFQRGDHWSHMFGVGRDATRTVPGPAAATARTVLAAAFMAEADPSGPDGCFGGGSNVPAPDQVMEVSVRVSLVKVRP